MLYRKPVGYLNTSLDFFCWPTWSQEKRIIWSQRNFEKLIGSNSLTRYIHLTFYVTTLFFLEIFHSKLPGVKASYVTSWIQSLFMSFICQSLTSRVYLFLMLQCTSYIYCGLVSHRLLSGRVWYVAPMEQINSRDTNYYQCQHTVHAHCT